MHSHRFLQEPPLVRLCLLALVIAVVVGVLIVLFRLAIFVPLQYLLPGDVENFEGLPPLARVGIILAGSVALWLLLTWVGPQHRQLSVSHVIDRLQNHRGDIPLRNWVAQFFGGIIALVSGHSAGQEGPIIHLGAGASAQMARALRLPQEQLRLLIAAGVAAAIGACFNTPLAGVILAMEVVLLEYSILGFIPVMLAAVVGATIGHTSLGSVSLASSGALAGYWQLLYILLGAGFIGCASALFIHINLYALRFAAWPLAARLALASLATAAVAWFWPQIMGLGFDTLQLALSGQLLLGSLIMIGLAKVIISPLSVGLGIPGGLIGPTLLSGACFGAALGLGAQQLFGIDQVQLQVYVLLGMAAMMAATLKAPLAALAAVLELSGNPQIILPTMLVIVMTCLIHKRVFKLDGIFIEQLKHRDRVLQLAQHPCPEPDSNEAPLTKLT